MAAVAERAVARRAFADARGRTISFAVLFGFVALLQTTAYRDAYPTAADRAGLARTIVDNPAVQVLYGRPFDLLSVEGYVSWRVGGGLAIFAAAWGMLGAIRAMRAEEEAGRADLVFAGAIGRVGAFAAQLAAIGAGTAALWAVTLAAFVAAGLPAGGVAFLALAIVSPAPVFAGVGALASQLAATRRLATALSSGVLVVALALRAVATTTDGMEWLAWASPLGWSTELRPFAEPRPAVLVLPALAAALLLAAAGALARRRDIGSGLLPARDSAPPRLRLLGSPAAQALRAERGALIAWIAGVGAFALLMGSLSDAVRSGISANLERELQKLGTGSVATAEGWLGFSFVYLILAVSLFCCAQIGAARREEAEQRIETLLALPLARRRWFAGRLLLAAAGAVALALAAGVCAWAGVAASGAGVSLPELLGAGANCLPAALLFLALGALAFALVPRMSAAVAYGLVAAAFVWQITGALLEVPGWMLTLSPFHDVGLVPGGSFKPVAAAVMLALATAGAVAATLIFERRDLSAA